MGVKTPPESSLHLSGDKGNQRLALLAQAGFSNL